MVLHKSVEENTPTTAANWTEEPAAHEIAPLAAYTDAAQENAPPQTEERLREEVPREFSSLGAPSAARCDAADVPPVSIAAAAAVAVTLEATLRAEPASDKLTVTEPFSSSPSDSPGPPEAAETLQPNLPFALSSPLRSSRGNAISLIPSPPLLASAGARHTPLHSFGTRIPMSHTAASLREDFDFRAALLLAVVTETEVCLEDALAVAATNSAAQASSLEDSCSPSTPRAASSSKPVPVLSLNSACTPPLQLRGCDSESGGQSSRSSQQDIALSDSETSEA
jgi:hypothetical protein